MIVAVAEIELPRTTLPEVGLSEIETVARNFAVIVPGPLIVAVVDEEVDEASVINEVLFDQLPNT